MFILKRVGYKTEFIIKYIKVFVLLNIVWHLIKLGICVNKKFGHLI